MKQPLPRQAPEGPGAIGRESAGDEDGQLTRLMRQLPHRSDCAGTDRRGAGVGKSEAAARPTGYGGTSTGGPAVTDYAAQQRITELSRNAAPEPKASPAPAAPGPELEPRLKTMTDIKEAFAGLREAIGETRYFEELQLAGVAGPSQFRTATQVRECWRRMVKIAELQRKELA